MFITPCFIGKNTPELREKLEKLGYSPALNGHGEWFIPMDELPYLETFPLSKSYMGRAAYWSTSVIDCGTNEELFLALAALRDDSDYMQWFISPKTHTKRLSGCFGQIVGMDGHYQEIVGYEWHIYENKDNALTERLNEMIQIEVEDMEFLPHKATAEEIIEHFTMKGGTK